MKQRLEFICEKENIGLPSVDNVEEDDEDMEVSGVEGSKKYPLDTLCDISQGDLRQAITLLQSAAKLLSPSSPTSSKLTSSMIEELACFVPVSFISELHNVIKKNNFSACHHLARRCMKEGYGGEVVIHAWLKVIIADLAIPEIKKARMIVKLGEIEKCLIDGANEYIQILYCISELTRILHKTES
jgi:replication factor C subunit 2/4